MVSISRSGAAGPGFHGREGRLLPLTKEANTPEATMRRSTEPKKLDVRLKSIEEHVS